MNRKQRRALTKRKQPIRTNHNMTIQLAKARDLKTLAHRVESDRQAQRCLWLAVVSMNDAFGIGNLGSKAQGKYSGICKDEP